MIMEKEDLEFLNKQYDCKNEFSETKISVSSKSFDSNEDAVREIQNFSPTDGWISLQSTPAYRVQSADITIGGEHILAGELCNSKESLSVRFNGEKWVFTTFREEECENANEESYVKRKVRQLSKFGNSTYLNYAVFYKFDPDFGYRPYCSAFKGFTEEK